MRTQDSQQPKNVGLLALFAITLCTCAVALLASTTSTAENPYSSLQTQPTLALSPVPPPPKPRPAPVRFRGLIGEYGPDDDVLIILENDGKLCAVRSRGEFETLDEVS